MSASLIRSIVLAAFSGLACGTVGYLAGHDEVSRTLTVATNSLSECVEALDRAVTVAEEIDFSLIQRMPTRWTDHKVMASVSHISVADDNSTD